MADSARFLRGSAIAEGSPYPERKPLPATGMRLLTLRRPEDNVATLPRRSMPASSWKKRGAAG
jgi:hypothetical protein